MPQSAIDTVFYDGACGFCHSSVRFLAEADRRGRLFRFAPLGGDTFAALIPAEQRAGLPDSVVVRTGDGRLLMRSAAVVYLMRRLGGWWRVAAALFGAVPTPLRDRLYDAFAGVRHRLFRR